MADTDDVILLESGHKDLQRCDFSKFSASDQRYVGLDFRGANLSDATFTRCNFEGCQFGNATLHSTDFSYSRFVGCIFDGDHIRVNFYDVTFEGGAFGGLVIAGSFKKSTFIGVNARNIHFGDNVILEEAYADKSTDFVGAKMPRALSKASLFSGYRFEGGALVRNDTPDVNTVDNQLETGADAGRLARRNVAVLLSTNRRSALVASLSLVSLIDDFLEGVPTPNDPEKLDFHQKYVEFLAEFRDAATLISSCLSEKSEERSIDQATESILTARELIEDWWVGNGPKAVEFGASVGLIGAGTAFLSFCGAPPTMATAICAVLGGSKALAEYMARTEKNG